MCVCTCVWRGTWTGTGEKREGEFDASEAGRQSSWDFFTFFKRRGTKGWRNERVKGQEAGRRTERGEVGRVSHERGE